MFWYQHRNVEVKRCRTAPESWIYKTKVTFWWQNNEKLEIRSQCHLLSVKKDLKSTRKGLFLEYFVKRVIKSTRRGLFFEIWRLEARQLRPEAGKDGDRVIEERRYIR